MSFQPVDLAILERRMVALETAMFVTLASLEKASLNAKADVIYTLERHASENPDPTIQEAFSKLATKIKALNVQDKPE
ncbi:hypothetical protein AAZR23_19340 [Morganella sp. Je.2.23]|uniref:hypothetical protein n=1 Tax=Morganella TaxID=581 RepID=UPI002367ECB8|nr:hypothetical protein [Morganella morganii]